MANPWKHKIEYYICEEINKKSPNSRLFLKGQVVSRFVLFYVIVISTYFSSFKDFYKNGLFSLNIKF